MAGRVGTRSFGVSTALVRPDPDFLLVGAKRGGTTSAYFHILGHPDVLPLFPSARLIPKARDTKGTSYFTSNYDRGSLWYRSHFPSQVQRVAHRLRNQHVPVAGEASPYYLFHPDAAARVHRMMPDAKILIALRDPVVRTHSAWREQTRNGVESLPFEAALDAEDARIAGEAERLLADPTYVSFSYEFQSYAHQSRYADSLARWFALFPRSNIHVWASEDYYEAPHETMAGVCAFLGLDRERLPLIKRTLNAAPPAPMDEALRQRLLEMFEDDIAATESLLGRRMPWPRR